jgi:hypothetical protein
VSVDSSERKTVRSAGPPIDRRLDAVCVPIGHSAFRRDQVEPIQRDFLARTMALQTGPPAVR